MFWTDLGSSGTRLFDGHTGLDQLEIETDQNRLWWVPETVENICTILDLSHSWLDVERAMATRSLVLWCYSKPSASRITVLNGEKKVR